MKWINIFIITSFVFTNLFADGIKKYAGEFLHLGVGGRALALGGAYVSVVNDVTAGYWNPAGLVEAKNFQIQFMHARLFLSSIQYDYIGISNHIKSGAALALSIMRLGVDDIKDSRNAGEYDQNGDLNLDYSKIVKFNTADYVFILSYARGITDKLSYGANVKLIYRDYYIESAHGIGFDLGAIYRFSPSLRVGLMLRDVTTTMMAWSTSNKEFVSPSVRPGISYQYNFNSIDLYIQPSFDFVIMGESRDNSSQLYLGGPLSIDTFWGLEIAFKHTAFLRFGYDDLERFCTGVGLHLHKFGVDYSYSNYNSELGDVHRIAFHLRLNSI